MPARQILTDIYKSSEVDAIIKRLRPVHLQEDIKQHTFLELFQKPEEFILDLHNRGRLKPFIVKILYNTATYTKSSFAKSLGKETPTDFCVASKFEIIRTSETEDREMAEMHASVQCGMSEMHWYKSRLLREYSEEGTYQKVADKTGIPIISIFATVREAKKEIKKKL